MNYYQIECVKGNVYKVPECRTRLKREYDHGLLFTNGNERTIIRQGYKYYTEGQRFYISDPYGNCIDFLPSETDHTYQELIELFDDCACCGEAIIEDIETLRVTPPEDDAVLVLGYYSDTPGTGGDHFFWDKNLDEDDNGGTIIKVESINEGRWVRIDKGYVNVKDFGARGNGVTNDTDALNRAGRQVQTNNGGRLVIPEGDYIVGLQEIDDTPNNPYYNYKTIISISGCTNSVDIDGSGARLIADDNLRFGSFDPVTGEVYNPSLPFTDHDYQVGVYTAMVNLNNNESVTVRNLNLFGNNENIVLGGEWGDTGRQCAGSGLRITGCRNTIISNVVSKYHALDGLYYKYDDLSPEDEATPLLIQNVDVRYNARQGFSHTGGILGTAINCRFGETGKGGFASAPGAGVDFEPSGSCIRKFTFINCEFSNNNGVAFVADSGDTADVKFLGCYLIGTTSRALWCDKPRMYFENTLIAGNIVALYSGDIGEATIFKNCVLTDNVDYSPTGQIYIDSVGLINESSANGVLFDECTFEATQGKIGRINYGKIKNCTFHTTVGTEQVANKDWLLLIGGSYIENCTITQDIAGTPPDDAYYISNSSIKSAGINKLTADGGKLKWSSWSSGAGGFEGEYGQNVNPINQEINLTRTGYSNNAEGSRKIKMSEDSPNGENWVKGDFVFKSNPSEKDPVGWRCIVSGSPGVNAIFEPVVNCSIRAFETYEDFPNNPEACILYIDFETSYQYVAYPGWSFLTEPTIYEPAFNDVSELPATADPDYIYLVEYPNSFQLYYWVDGSYVAVGYSGGALPEPAVLGEYYYGADDSNTGVFIGQYNYRNITYIQDVLNLFTEDLTLDEQRTHLINDFFRFNLGEDGYYYISGDGVNFTMAQDSISLTAQKNAPTPAVVGVGDGSLLLMDGKNIIIPGNDFYTLKLVSSNGESEWVPLPDYSATTIQYLDADSSSTVWDLDVGSMAIITLRSDTQINVVNRKPGVFNMILLQDLTGSRVVTFNSNIKWPGGATPILSTDPFSTDVIRFVCNGVSMYGTAEIDYS